METNVRVRGEIRWGHVARSRAVRKIIERSIARWVAIHAPRPEGEPPHYRAYIQREGEGHLVSCEIEVVAGRHAWSGSRMGQGLQQALSDCLAHMNAVSMSLVFPEPQPLT